MPDWSTAGGLRRGMRGPEDELPIHEASNCGSCCKRIPDDAPWNLLDAHIDEDSNTMYFTCPTCIIGELRDEVKRLSEALEDAESECLTIAAERNALRGRVDDLGFEIKEAMERMED